MQLQNLILRQAIKKDLPEIVRLYGEDELGTTREKLSDPLLPSYEKAFHTIQEDKNQTLLVIEYHQEIIGTCHLTFMPSLSFKGSWRLNLENIHIDKRFQNQGVGTCMLEKAIAIGQEKSCKIIQLTTNKKRIRAKSFYEKLGFQPTHEGMKLYLC
jgi:ribosomal protein S18 acetylase RimI-like enzyme